MRINSINKNSFNGYDARPLKGFFMGSNSHNLAREIQNIGYKEGFKVFSKQKTSLQNNCGECIPDLIPSNNTELWAQDVWTFLKNKLISNFNDTDNITISNYFGIEKEASKEHVAGGNFFIVDNNGSDELFIGENSLNSLQTLTIKDIEKKFNVKKVFVLPQMDFHIDLFMRPLDNKNILLADDNLTLKILEDGYEKLLDYISAKHAEDDPMATCIKDCFLSQIFKFRMMYNNNINPQADKIAEIIKNAGYNPIRVPGRIYTVTNFADKMLFLSHDCNYINAAVIKNENDEIIYITNKSNIDKMLGLETGFAKDFDFRFEKEFIKSIEPYVNPDKIYFVNGDNDYISKVMLKGMQGGVHCICSEIPNK